MSIATAPAQHAATDSRPAGRGYRLTWRGVLAGEWTKYWTVRSTWITTAISAALLIAIGVIASASYNPAETHGPAAGPGMTAVDLALAGTTLAAMAVGVLGVLLAAGEYTTGMIRSTLTAVPTRLPVLWAKSLIAGGSAFVVMTVAAFAAFFISKPVLDSNAGSMSLGDDGVLRALIGAGLYLGLVAVFAVGVGALVRSSAGGIAIVAGSLLILPGLVSLLPSSWSDHISKYLPGTAGSQIMSLHTADGSLGPWTGLGVFAIWVVVVLGVAAWRLKKSDA